MPSQSLAAIHRRGDKGGQRTIRDSISVARFCQRRRLSVWSSRSIFRSSLAWSFSARSFRSC